MSVPKPAAILGPDGDVYQMDATTPLNLLAVDRIQSGRDLKIIITAEDSQTGVGKTTLAGWLALQWTLTFTDREWYCDPENPTEGMATLNPKEYFKIVKRVGTEWPAGTTVIVDDAEELDARRSMQDLNVEFSQRWMLMRLKQAITIITLPSPSAIDTRLEELADVWINVERRGKAMVHDLGVQSYGSRDVYHSREHYIEWPDISWHPELRKLRKMKENKMDDWDTDDGEEEEDDAPPLQAQAIEAKRIYDEHDGVGKDKCTWSEVPAIAERSDEYMELTYDGDYLRRQVKEVLPNA